MKILNWKTSHALGQPMSQSIEKILDFLGSKPFPRFATHVVECIRFEK